MQCNSMIRVVKVNVLCLRVELSQKHRASFILALKYLFIQNVHDEKQEFQEVMWLSSIERPEI